MEVSAETKIYAEELKYRSIRYDQRRKLLSWYRIEFLKENYKKAFAIKKALIHMIRNSNYDFDHYPLFVPISEGGAGTVKQTESQIVAEVE